jgi:hypothetical protein
VRKLTVLVALCLAVFASQASAVVNLGLPATDVNFDGNGVFDSTVPGSFDQLGPEAPAVDSMFFGVGTISDVALKSDPGNMVWVPTDVGPNFEMTFSFWNAVVTSSSRTWLGTPGASTAVFYTTYADGARILLVSDTSKDFDSTGGPSLFDTQDGEYPTVYTLEDAGYNSDGLPDATSKFIYSNDPDEEVFLDLMLSGCSSLISWNPALGFQSGAFTASSLEILGGAGADQFLDSFAGDGDSNAAFWLRIPPEGWTYGADIDIRLTAVPEPATLIFFGTGLVSLLGYGLRRRMA